MGQNLPLIRGNTRRLGYQRVPKLTLATRAAVPRWRLTAHSANRGQPTRAARAGHGAALVDGADRASFLPRGRQRMPHRPPAGTVLETSDATGWHAATSGVAICYVE